MKNIRQVLWIVGFAAIPALAQQTATTQENPIFLNKYSVSFDCAKAGNFAEKSVCSNAKLGQLDGLLLSTYKSRLSPQFGADKNLMKKQQKDWMTERNTCSDASCLEQSYKNRINELCEMPVVSGVHFDGDCDQLAL